MKLSSPCIDCGEPVKATRCDDCTRRSNRMRIRTRTRKRNRSTAGRGYGSKWKRLSERARELQRFCSDCGDTQDLQADHSPEAWERYEKGLPLRLADVDVVCAECNRKRGAARPGSDRSRSKPSSTPDRPRPHRDDSKPSGGYTEPGGGPLAGQRHDSPLGPNSPSDWLPRANVWVR